MEYFSRDFFKNYNVYCMHIGKKKIWISFLLNKIFNENACFCVNSLLFAMPIINCLRFAANFNRNDGILYRQRALSSQRA